MYVEARNSELTEPVGRANGEQRRRETVRREVGPALIFEVGAEIDRHKIVLERPIKDTGEHEVAIKLHHDVTAQLVFQVKSAAEPKPDVAPAAAPEEPDKKKRRLFRRKREQPKQEEK